MANVLYWIRLPKHTDMFTQGYIGITNNFKRRLYKHKNATQNAHLKNAVLKYGWNTLVKKVILIANETYCLAIESALRAKENIGWNIVEGGGMPPRNNKGFAKGSIPWNKGTAKPKKAPKPRVAWNKGLSTPDSVKEKQRIAKLGKVGSRLGKKNSDEHNAAISKSRKGIRLADEVYAKQALARTGFKHEIVTCPHCGKSGGITAMPRWHFNNCKEYK